MAAVMIVMVVFMLIGPHHGFMQSREATPPKAEAAVTQVDWTGKSEQ